MSIYVPPPDVTRTRRVYGPGPDALRATQEAAKVARSLEDSGHELSFSTPAPGGRVGVQLRGPDGSVTELSPTELLAVAAGEVVPGAPVVGEARWPWL